MPADVMTIIVFLCLGYALFLVELVVPGGVLGILGVLSVLYGCYLAFGVGFVWGAIAIIASVLFFVFSIRWLLRSKTGRRLTMSDADLVQSSKSTDKEWQHFVGQGGVAASPLRPAGLAEIDGQRVDVVSDNEFLDAGTKIRVIHVEGRRIVVEAVPEEFAAEVAPEASAAPRETSAAPTEEENSTVT